MAGTTGKPPRRVTTRQEPVLDLHDFYKNLPRIGSKFKSLDLDESFLEAESAVLNPTTKNLVIDYGHDRAYCAVNVGVGDEADQDGAILDLKCERPQELDSRWIAIFGPHDQQKLVKELANEYGLSPRHIQLLISNPPTPAKEGEAGAVRGYMDIANKVYHWHAVEMGGRYLAIGYNSLFDISPSKEDKDRMEREAMKLRHMTAKARQKAEKEYTFKKNTVYPDGTRIWQWLILTEDGTVLSLHEKLHRGADTIGDYTRRVEVVRRNLVAILRSLSVSEAAQAAKMRVMRNGGIQAMQQFPFRSTREKYVTDAVFAGPSLIFYYLFDDWETSFKLAIERSHPYSTRMTEIRNELLKSPGLMQIEDLYSIARKLNILKRMYQTYGVIIDRILHKHENAAITSRMDKGEMNIIVPSSATGEVGRADILGVPLHPEANKRFERLKDRITLYALAEIDDCLEEQAGLVDMALNLMTLSQGKSVDRLTRVALLLAKATIFFLPVSFVVQFFSTSVDELSSMFTKKDVIGSAAVTVALTMLFLSFLSIYTGTSEVGGLVFHIREIMQTKKNKKEAKESNENTKAVDSEKGMVSISDDSGNLEAGVIRAR